MRYFFRFVCKSISVLLLVSLLVSGGVPAFAELSPGLGELAAENHASLLAEAPKFAFDAKSVLLMEARTGTILYEDNADEALPPASVTKVMTLLLIMEALDDGKIALSDVVTVSERSASMGGSQIFLKVGEQMSVEDLLKSVVIASANDAALALAEFVLGSEDAFVARMNERAGELGMNHTHFVNTNGLDDTTSDHLISARDIAIVSRELIVSHPAILKYSSTWQDSVRNGAFTLSNTNRLVRFYPGANGLKTGSTSKAGFCVSASAERDGMLLIAVVMGSSTRNARNETAKQLFDYGFANYSCVRIPGNDRITEDVKGSMTKSVSCSYPSFDFVCRKGKNEIEPKITLSNDLKAPVSAGDVVGTVTYYLDGKEIGSSEIVSEESAEKARLSDIFLLALKKYLLN